jgi:hypothetical protein
LPGNSKFLPFHVLKKVLSIILLKLFVIPTMLHHFIVGVLRICIYSGVFIGSISSRNLFSRKRSVVLRSQGNLVHQSLLAPKDVSAGGQA